MNSLVYSSLHCNRCTCLFKILALKQGQRCPWNYVVIVQCFYKVTAFKQGKSKDWPGVVMGPRLTKHLALIRDTGSLGGCGHGLHSSLPCTFCFMAHALVPMGAQMEVQLQCSGSLGVICLLPLRGVACQQCRLNMVWQSGASLFLEVLQT